MTALLDSGFLLAVLDADDELHDQRHFQMFRPKHCPALEIVP
jgi:hypothetical protein